MEFVGFYLIPFVLFSYFYHYNAVYDGVDTEHTHAHTTRCVTRSWHESCLVPEISMPIPLEINFRAHSLDSKLLKEM
jgi:hypothetical protein